MKYTVKETRKAIQTWTYFIEASSEEEAIEKVQEGTIDADNYVVDDDDEFQDSTFTIN